MSSAGVAAAISIARKHLFSKFAVHNAYDKDNAISYDMLELNNKNIEWHNVCLANIVIKILLKSIITAFGLIGKR